MSFERRITLPAGSPLESMRTGGLLVRDPSMLRFIPA